MSHPSVRRPSGPRPSRPRGGAGGSCSWAWCCPRSAPAWCRPGGPAPWSCTSRATRPPSSAGPAGTAATPWAGLGQAWCIDHGLRAPDADLGYAPTGPPGVPATTRTAMAWLVSTAGRAPSRLDAAAIMLVLHDLVGAIYPGGRLDLRHLTPAQFAGFGGEEAALLDRARTLRGQRGRGRRAGRPAPAPGPAPGAPAAERAWRGGRPGVRPGRPPTRRGARHLPRRPLRALAHHGRHRCRRSRLRPRHGPLLGRARGGHGHRALTSLLHVFGPAGALGPARRGAGAGRRCTPTPRVVPVPAVVRLLKVGDGTPAVGVAGAHFTLRRLGSRGPGPVIATLVTGADGSTRAVTLVPGAYLVEETAPPPGYRGAGPWTVHLIAGTTRTIRLADPVARSTLRLQKVDAQTGRPLAGAVLQLRADRDADGTFETALRRSPPPRHPIDLGNLLPGRYQVVELRAPAGYLRFPPQVVILARGCVGGGAPHRSAGAARHQHHLHHLHHAPAASHLDHHVHARPPRSTTSPPSSLPPARRPPARPFPTPPLAPAPPEAATPPEVPTAPELPRTGSNTTGLGLLGAGIVCLGESLVLTVRRRP